MTLISAAPAGDAAVKAGSRIARLIAAATPAEQHTPGAQYFSVVAMSSPRNGRCLRSGAPFEDYVTDAGPTDGAIPRRSQKSRTLARRVRYNRAAAMQDARGTGPRDVNRRRRLLLPARHRRGEPHARAASTIRSHRPP